jgi:hypothetical protein
MGYSPARRLLRRPDARYQRMKPLFLSVWALAAGSSLAAPLAEPADLRVLLQRQAAAAPVPPPVPRQLTEAQRAELRRQLQAFRQPAQPAQPRR